MIEADLQYTGKELVPYSAEAKDLLSDLKPNQIVRGKITGVKKPRSVKQLRMFWACCRTVADNTEDQNWNTPEKVCIQVKLALRFYKEIVVLPDGSIHFELDSISFDNLGQVEANKIFDRSWPVMAKHIGVSADELLNNAKRYYDSKK